MNRRKFVTDTALSAVGLMLGGDLMAAAAPASTAAKAPKVARYDIMKDVMRYRKIDTHMHSRTTNFDNLIDIGDRLGIQKMVMVNHAYPPWPAPDAYRAINDIAIA